MDVRSLHGPGPMPVSEPAEVKTTYVPVSIFERVVATIKNIMVIIVCAVIIFGVLTLLRAVAEFGQTLQQQTPGLGG